MKVVILGDGLLGRELHKQTDWTILSRKKSNIDLRDSNTYVDFIKDYDVVVNCIAHTDTYSVDRQLHWDVNVLALNDLIDVCNAWDKKLIHISTDYVYANSISHATEDDVPVSIGTWYGYTKLVGDAMVQARSKNFLVCRMSHKPTPFPYDTAWCDVFTNCDTVDVIGNLVVDLINNGACGVYNVGTELKTIYDLAIRTNPNATKISRPSYVPEDISMDNKKLQHFLEKRCTN